VDSLDDLASAFNILNKGFPGYEDRPQQIEMAGEVFACLRDSKRLMVEAGTGVGKSFAYLIPAILSEKKTIVSTATIALQDQLANKDLVFLRKVLSQRFSFAILKGKNNYLCLKREREFAALGEPYKRFSKWVSRTKTGDRDELPFIPDFWARVCGDSEDCSGRMCPFYDDCFYYRHYRHLNKKDILVVNHHLLIYDLLSDFGLLPFHEQLIIDEAHQLEDVISHVLGSILRHSRVVWLLYRLRGLKIAVDHLLGPVDSFFKRGAMPFRAVYPIPDSIIEGLQNLRRLLALDKVISRLNAHKESVSGDELKDRVETTITRVKSLAMDIDDFIEQGDEERVYYMTGDREALELESSLVESRRPFGDLVSGYGSLVLTSATLTVSGNFSFLKHRLGIRDFRERVIGSPFDYRRQGLLYIDKELPAPDIENTKTFRRESMKIIEGLIHASRGRALVLFTSYNHLRFVSENIRIDNPFKLQGDMPPPRLIQWFKETPSPVLLATATFWQGIDIKGDKLSLVVIVKMPFGSPGDPVYDERCRRLGEQWFTDLALPSAILLLRQGVGRLIRGIDEHGVVAILDTRLLTSSYGRTIVSSLPEMDVVHSIEDVKRFFDSIPQPASPEVQTIAVSQGHGICPSDTEKKMGISRVVALGNSSDPSVIPELIGFTTSSNGNERRLAASALGKLARFKPEIYEAVEALEGLLADEKPQVRQYALKALATIGRVNKERLQPIIEDLEEKGYNVSLARRIIRKARV